VIGSEEQEDFSLSSVGAMAEWSFDGYTIMEWVNSVMIVVSTNHDDDGELTLWSAPYWSSTSLTCVIESTSTILHQIKSKMDIDGTLGWNVDDVVPSRDYHHRCGVIIEHIAMSLMSSSCGGWSLLDLIRIVLSYLI
jgi:hypothetical protein